MNNITELEQISLDTIPKEKILAFEKAFSKVPGVMFGDCFPLEHSFADGLYIREIRVPAGSLVVTKLFKQTHATFLMKGEVSVVTESGIVRMKAPCQLITKKGTKRVIFVHEDVVWTTVHANPGDSKDLQLIESRVIAKNYGELGMSVDEQKLIEMAMDFAISNQKEETSCLG